MPWTKQDYVECQGVIKEQAKKDPQIQKGSGGAMKTGTGNMDELSHTLILFALTIFSNKMGNVLEPTITLTIIPEEISKPHRRASEFSVNCPALFHDWGE